MAIKEKLKYPKRVDDYDFYPDAQGYWYRMSRDQSREYRADPEQQEDINRQLAGLESKRPNKSNSKKAKRPNLRIVA